MTRAYESTLALQSRKLACDSQLSVLQTEAQAQSDLLTLSEAQQIAAKR